MRRYRIIVTVETYENEDCLLDEDTFPTRERTNQSISDNYEKVMKVMSDALSQFDVDPLHGEDWD